MKKIHILFTISFFSPFFTHSISNELQNYVKEEIRSYDSKLSEKLWGPRGEVRGRIETAINNLNDHLYPLIRQSNEEIASIKKDNQNLNAKAQLIIRHVSNILETIKSDRKLAQVLAEKEKLASR